MEEGLDIWYPHSGHRELGCGDAPTTRRTECGKGQVRRLLCAPVGGLTLQLDQWRGPLHSSVWTQDRAGKHARPIPCGACWCQHGRATKVQKQHL